MPKQLEFKRVKGWGGKRRGAGRPNKSGRAGHAKRALVDFKKPLHVTLRLIDKMPNLRTKEFLRHFKTAGLRAKKFNLYLNHYSILGNHIHLIVEARDNHSLELGMKSLCGRLGKFLRKTQGGRGAVWLGRFHLHILRTPTEVKRALEYVLLNRAKHSKLLTHLDEFSSGYVFKDWQKLLGRKISPLMKEQLASNTKMLDEVSPARSWLLNSGWMRAS